MISNFYLQAFVTFFKIGLFTIGGGYAMIPMIEAEVVDKRKWIEREEFLDLMALAQMLPGVFAVNFSIHIGHRLRGLKGSLVMALGVILPSFLIILLVAMFFVTMAGNPVVEAVFKGLRPAVVALIAAPCVKLGRASHITIYNLWLPVSVAALIALFGISPVYIILVVALAGFAYGRFFKKEDE